MICWVSRWPVPINQTKSEEEIRQPNGVRLIISYWTLYFTFNSEGYYFNTIQLYRAPSSSQKKMPNAHKLADTINNKEGAEHFARSKCCHLSVPTDNIWCLSSFYLKAWEGGETWKTSLSLLHQIMFCASRKEVVQLKSFENIPSYHHRTELIQTNN